MSPGTTVALKREVSAIQIPSGDRVVLSEGALVFVTQTLGGSFTVQAPAYGGLFRIDGKDADALGAEPSNPAEASAPSRSPDSQEPLDETKLWDQLRKCYDPEIPVNIVDLGLVYDLAIRPVATGGSRIEVKMTLTAPGCGMGTAIASDARHKLQGVSGVSEADVQLVWDPPWNAEMMSDAGKRALGMA